MAVDGQGEVAGNDEDTLPGQSAVDSDDIVTPPDMAGFMDVVHAGAHGSSDRFSWGGWWACPPAFGGSLATQGFVRSGVVVVRTPAVELVLQLL